MFSKSKIYENNDDSQPPTEKEDIDFPLSFSYRNLRTDLLLHYILLNLQNLLQYSQSAVHQTIYLWPSLLQIYCLAF